MTPLKKQGHQCKAGIRLNNEQIHNHQLSDDSETLEGQNSIVERQGKKAHEGKWQ
jgi:hypothetical protein